MGSREPNKFLSERFGYEVTIEWSEDEAVFYAVVPELPGCMVEGSTYQEARLGIEPAIIEWIHMAKKLGWEVPEPGAE